MCYLKEAGVIFCYKQTRFLILIPLFLIFSKLAIAAPDTEQQQIIPATSLTVKQPLTIAIDADLAPYYSMNKQNELIGLMPDFWHLWAKKQQVEIEFVVLNNWSETLKQVALGNIDIHGGLAFLNSRRATLDFSKPFFSKYLSIYVNQTVKNVNSLDDLKPYTIGSVAGAIEMESLKNSYPYFSIKTYANRRDLFQAALNNEILAFSIFGGNLIDNFPGNEVLRKNFPEHKLLRFQHHKFGVAVAKGRTDLLAYINEGFDKISIKERVAIENKWLTLDKKKDSLSIVYSSDYPPYTGVSPLGEAQGLLIDVWRLWSKQTGINVEFVAREIHEAIDLIAEQKADILFAFTNNIQISKNILFSKPIYTGTSRVYLHNKIKGQDGGNILSLAQLSQEVDHHSLGLWHLSTLKKQLIAQFPKLNIHYFNSATTMLMAAERGEISGFFGLSNIVNARLVERNLQNSFYSLNEPVISISISPVIHVQNKKLLQIINDGFSQLDINDLIKIEEKWLNGNSNETYYKKQARNVSLNEAEEAFINTHKKINLGIVKNLSPIEFLSVEGRFSGINQEIIKLISDRTGLEFNVIAFDNWLALYNALLNNEIDVLANILATEKREKQMLFTNSYWKMAWVIIHPQHEGRQTNLEYFYGKEVAIIKDYDLLSMLLKKHPLITFKLVSDREQGLVALEQERVDGFITTIASAMYLLKSEKGVDFRISVVDDVSVGENRFGINTRLPLLKAIMNKGLSTISEIEKQTIYDNWFTLEIKTGLDEKEVLKLASKIGLGILIVLGIMLMWNRRLQVEIKHRERLEKKMQHMATHDELTSLANRVLLKDRLTTAIDFHHRQRLKMAVLFIDLDGFKKVNDTYGHDIGDQLLQQVAQRLLDCVRSSDTVVRFGGDEFVLLLTCLSHENEASYVADKVLRAIQKEFGLAETSIFIGCSIGIAMYPADGDNTLELLKVADTLMYEVKAAGKNHYIFNKPKC